MKTLILGTLIMSAAVVAYAGHYDDNTVMDQSVLNDHGPGLAATSINPGEGEDYGSILYGMDYLEGYQDGPAQKGEGEEYGSILLDVE